MSVSSTDILSLFGNKAPVPLGPKFPPSLASIVLPSVMAEYCSELSESLQVPYEMVLCNLFGVLSTAAQRRFQIQVKEGYCESLNLYLLSPLPPSERKSAVAHNIGLHNRILRMENQGQPRRADKDQRAGRESEKEHKQIYGMGHQGISDRRSAISSISQWDKSENRSDKQRPASRFIAEVDHERVIKELVGGPSRNGEGAVPPLERAGSENSRAGAQDLGVGKGSPRLPGLAERIGRCFAEVGAVVRAVREFTNVRKYSGKKKQIKLGM